jgi:hypothetical protein
MKTLFTRASVLMLAFSSVNTLHFAAEPAKAEEPLPKGNEGQPKTAVQQATRQIAVPVLDIDAMSEDEVRAALKRLQSQQGTQRGATRTIRFNDGSDPTYYTAGDKLLDSQGRVTNKTAVGGEVKSARDSGTMSIYGFGRNPISLYPSQWLELCAFMPDIVNFVGSNVDHINTYLQEHSKGRADRINEELVLQLQEWFGAHEEVTKLETQLETLQAELTELRGGVIADPEVENLADEVGGES